MRLVDDIWMDGPDNTNEVFTDVDEEHEARSGCESIGI